MPDRTYHQASNVVLSECDSENDEHLNLKHNIYRRRALCKHPSSWSNPAFSTRRRLCHAFAKSLPQPVSILLSTLTFSIGDYFIVNT